MTSVNQPLRESDVSQWHHQTEVIVVGYGGAGSSAALEAARGGVAVTIVEIAGGGGGTTAMCGGHVYCGGGTPVQKANNFEDSAEDLYQYLMKCADFQDADKARLYADNSVDHFNWLEQQGVPFRRDYFPTRHNLQPDGTCLIWTGNEKAWPFTEVAKPAPRGHKADGEGNAGHLIMKALIAQVEQLPIETYFNTAVNQLIIDDTGRVVGIAGTQFGETLYLKAEKGVILTAGGFIMNHTMVANHIPDLGEDTIDHGSPYDDGSGIQLGTSVGGAAIHMADYFVCLPFYPPEDLTYGLLINNQGQRFINEDCYHSRIGYATMNQRDNEAYLIVDNSCFEIPDINKYAGETEGSGYSIEHVATEANIADLEAALGLPLNTLQNTMAVYNDNAANGDDPLFHKNASWLKPLNNGPYAAFDVSLGKAPYTAFTLGGLSTLPTGEVLDERGGVIVGLYSAGRNSCGLPRTSSGYSSGISVGDATFFGRLAGKSVALQSE
jgi:3-oxo-5alpha-steroid 4-dehydrogenase